MVGILSLGMVTVQQILLSSVVVAKYHLGKVRLQPVQQVVVPSMAHDL